MNFRTKLENREKKILPLQAFVAAVEAVEVVP